MKIVIDRETTVEGLGNAFPEDVVDVPPEVAEILIVNGDGHPLSPIVRPDPVRITLGESKDG